MQATDEELFLQNLILSQQLNEALAENQALKAEIKELKEKLNTNSSNSSKPPSQDPFREPGTKKPKGRSQGAQKGHQGHSRQLIPIEQVQTQHDLKPDVCPNCQSNSFDTD